MVRTLGRVALLGVVLALWGCSLEKGQLAGVISDAQGRALGGVEVHLGNQFTRTNVQGQYVFIDVDPGRYRFSVVARGFQQYDQQLRLRPGIQQANLALAPTVATVVAAPADPPATASPAQPPPQSLPQVEPKDTSSPSFKLPLPGGYDWLLSTEPGGAFYGGEPDLGHRGRSYYALDFIDNNKQRGELDGFPVPILAAADGVVVATRNDVICRGCHLGYGNYVKLDHGNGFLTVYGHMRYPSVTVRVGERVHQGQVLGFMGTTGHSTGIHVHFEVRYLDEGAKQAAVLEGVLVDGTPLSQYKVGTVSHPRYYHSSQTLP